MGDLFLRHIRFVFDEVPFHAVLLRCFQDRRHIHLTGAQRVPALATSDTVRGLRSELLRDESALAAARERYRKAAASYNAMRDAFPGAPLLAALAYPDLPAGL